jgi:hypothetical protein
MYKKINTFIKNQIMKYFLSSLCTLLVLIGHSQHSDLKEFGFRGKVKEVRTKTYVYIDFKTGKPSDSLNHFSTVVFYVDEHDNFQEVKTISGIDSTVIVRNIYTFKDSKKSSMKSIDSDGNEIKNESASFVWVDDKTYLLTLLSHSRTYEMMIMLNEYYRDFKGVTQIFDHKNTDKKLVKTEKSENFFDYDGHIRKIIVTDMESMTETIRFVKDKVLDEHGNLIQYKVVDESGNVLQYVEREFFY